MPTNPFNSPFPSDPFEYDDDEKQRRKSLMDQMDGGPAASQGFAPTPPGTTKNSLYGFGTAFTNQGRYDQPFVPGLSQLDARGFTTVPLPEQPPQIEDLPEVTIPTRQPEGGRLEEVTGRRSAEPVRGVGGQAFDTIFGGGFDPQAFLGQGDSLSRIQEFIRELSSGRGGGASRSALLGLLR